MVNRWIDSNVLAQKIALLQICSGARIGEILYKGEFKKAKKKHHVIQTGILKSKDKNITVTKPILFISVSDFLGLFKSVRENIKGENTNNVYKRVVRCLKDKYGLKTHTLRKIYAEIAWQTYGGTAKQSFYASEILGHDVNSTASANSYTTIHIGNINKKTAVSIHSPP
jgi:integrase